MSSDIEIELQDESEEIAGGVQLPVNFLAFGEFEHDDVKVYIKQDVYKALEKYALAEVEHERGTILFGDYCEDLGKTHVVISNYVEAKYTDASASTLTFTHETWNYVHKEHDAKYPDKKIVGWQHTHPNYGIFLSNYDLFIHENFFNLPFQVAYVIDPIQNIRGFFQWKNGKIEKLKGYYIFDDVGKPIKIEQTRKTEKKDAPAGKKTSWLATVGIILALLLAAASLFTILRMHGKIREQEKKQAELEQTILVQDNALRDLQNNQPTQTGNAETVTAEELLDRIEAQQITIDDQQTVIDELRSMIEELQETSENSNFILYSVKPGDTLGSICAELNIDYFKNRSVILGLNGIYDENIIYDGQVLVFPAGLCDD